MEERLSEKQIVALTSVLAAGGLMLMKLVVGLETGSLGILSDAAHSGLDLVAAGVTYFSVRMADMPADPSHPFGHDKFESLSAFIETALLLVTCAWIVFESLERLLVQAVRVELSVWAFGVMVVSMLIDTLRSRALYRVARKHPSQALEADALHFSTDVYSSGVVLLGLLLVWISEHWKIAWLGRADPLAALVVAAIIVKITLRLGRKTVDVLVDTAPEGAEASIAKALESVDGVLKGDRIRVRQSGSRFFVDLRLTLGSNIPFEHAQSVVDLAETKVRELFPAADVVIRALPRQPAQGDLLEKIRAIAHRGNFQVHDVAAFEVGGRIHVDLDLVVDPDLKLEEAHPQATRLEQQISHELAGVERVNVHLEPLIKSVEAAGESGLDKEAIERKLIEIARKTPGLVDCHSVEAHLVGGNMLVRLHCTMEPRLPISLVHEITERIEFRFRRAFPQISKVSIHAEPEGGGEESLTPPPA
jgi:cation diffusion facilitator family transporter